LRSGCRSTREALPKTVHRRYSKSRRRRRRAHKLRPPGPDFDAWPLDKSAAQRLRQIQSPRIVGGLLIAYQTIFLIHPVGVNTHPNLISRVFAWPSSSLPRRPSVSFFPTGTPGPSVPPGIRGLSLTRTIRSDKAASASLAGSSSCCPPPSPTPVRLHWRLPECRPVWRGLPVRVQTNEERRPSSLFAAFPNFRMSPRYRGRDLLDNRRYRIHGLYRSPA
jgi:hypothetical protein